MRRCCAYSIWGLAWLLIAAAENAELVQHLIPEETWVIGELVEGDERWFWCDENGAVSPGGVDLRQRDEFAGRAGCLRERAIACPGGGGHFQQGRALRAGTRPPERACRRCACPKPKEGDRGDYDRQLAEPGGSICSRIGSSWRVGCACFIRSFLEAFSRSG